MKLSRSQNPNPMPSSTQPDASEPVRTPASASARVTVEDLLRLKRAERPESEFWTGFENQLRQRQLAAAIHEKRPWWHALPATLPRFAIVFPIGATAALAISIIVWRDAGRQTAAPTATPAPALATTASAENTGAGAAIATATKPISPAAPATATLSLAATDPDMTDTLDETDWHDFVPPTPDTPGKPTAAEVAATQPVSEEHIQTAHTAFAAATSAARVSNFALVTLAGARSAALTRNISSSTLMAMPVLASDLPAVTINAITDSSNAAATPLQTADDTPRAVRVRDRASLLNDKVLTDNVSRFGATGDSLSIKF